MCPPLLFTLPHHPSIIHVHICYIYTLEQNIAATQDPGSRTLATAFKIQCLVQNHGTGFLRILDPGSKTQRPITNILSPDYWNQIPGSRILDLVSWPRNLDAGSWIHGAVHRILYPRQQQSSNRIEAYRMCISK